MFSFSLLRGRIHRLCLFLFSVIAACSFKLDLEKETNKCENLNEFIHSANDALSFRLPAVAPSHARILFPLKCIYIYTYIFTHSEFRSSDLHFIFTITFSPTAPSMCVCVRERERHYSWRCWILIRTVRKRIRSQNSREESNI